MIDKKYLELINKDIDKVISEEEKKALLKFIGENPDAGKLYDEYNRTDQMLSKLPEREPSPELESRIISSIDFNRYNPKSKPLSVFSGFIPALKSKWTFSFSFGLAAGIIILAVILSVTNLVRTSVEKDIYGTIGITSTEVSRSFSSESPDYSFKIDLLKVKANDNENHFAFNVDINPPEEYVLELNYNPENVTFENLSSVKFKKINLESTSGKIRIFPSSTSRFSIMLSLKDPREEIGVNLLKGDKYIFNRRISLL